MYSEDLQSNFVCASPYLETLTVEAAWVLRNTVSSFRRAATISAGTGRKITVALAISRTGIPKHSMLLLNSGNNSGKLLMKVSHSQSHMHIGINELYT